MLRCEGRSHQSLEPPLKTALFLLLVVILAVVTLVILKRRGLTGPASDAPWPFYAKRPLSQPEQVLYH